MATKTKAKQLTAAEKELVATGCKFPGDDLCPAVVAKASPYTYQKYGCRGQACQEINSDYYKAHWAESQVKKQKAEEKAERDVLRSTSRGFKPKKFKTKKTTAGRR